MLTDSVAPPAPPNHYATQHLQHSCTPPQHADVVPVGTKTYDALSPKTNDDPTGSDSSNRR